MHGFWCNKLPQTEGRLAMLRLQPIRKYVLVTIVCFLLLWSFFSFQNSLKENYRNINSKQLEFSLLLRDLDASTNYSSHSIDEILRSRAKAVQERCKVMSWGLSAVAEQLSKSCNSSPYQKTRTLISKQGSALYKKRFLFTPIPKCGWTTWDKLLFTSAGKFQEYKEIFKFAWDSPFYLAELEKTGLTGCPYDDQTEERILYTRDPYERLVSAYQDKVLNNNGLYLKLWSNPCPWINNTTRNATISFPQFVTCILDKAKSQSGILSSEGASQTLDHHWTPIFHLSQPCTANYTLVVEFSNFAIETPHVLDILGINATVTVENKTKKKSGSTLASYYGQLDKDMIDELQDLYMYDFAIFGYSIQPPWLKDIIE